MGNLSRFFGRHVGASLIGAAGVILAALGYADQAGAIITRFEPWQLQATGAGLFVVFVVMVLASYDRDHVSARIAVPVSIPAPDTTTQSPVNFVPIQASDGPDPSVLPPAVVNEYLTMLMSKPTQLQQRRMMKPYAGKWMLLDLKLRAIQRSGDEIQAMLRKETGDGDSEYIFAHFDIKWEDHLHGVRKGDILRFKGRIVVDDRREPYFADAVPL